RRSRWRMACARPSRGTGRGARRPPRGGRDETSCVNPEARHGCAGARPSDGGCGGPYRGPPRRSMSERPIPNAVPVFVDVEASTWGLDPAKVDGFLAKECDVRGGVVVNRATGRTVRAVLPVHLYGHPVDLDAFLDVAARWPVALVEDSAESLGARYKGRAVGVAGLAGCLSFNGNKIVTAGGGGMLLTNDAAVAERARSLTTHARADATEWIHREVGYNYRLTNLQAALGVAQLEQLGAFVEAKRRTADAYAAAVAALEGVEPFVEQPWAHSTY